MWLFFQILCRKFQSGTSGSFWWIQRGRWSGSGEPTSPWRASDKRPRLWCEKSSWRNGWSYDGAYGQILDTPLCFEQPGITSGGLWTVTVGLVGWWLAPDTRRTKSAPKSECQALSVCNRDHPVVNNDSDEEHSLWWPLLQLKDCLAFEVLEFYSFNLA